MPVPKRAPMSRMERFVEALTLLQRYQPAAEMFRVGSVLLVGDLTDPHLPEGMIAKMGDYGFMREDTHKMFAYALPEPPKKR